MVKKKFLQFGKKVLGIRMKSTAFATRMEWLPLPKARPGGISVLEGVRCEVKPRFWGKFGGPVHIYCLKKIHTHADLETFVHCLVPHWRPSLLQAHLLSTACNLQTRVVFLVTAAADETRRGGVLCSKVGRGRRRRRRRRWMQTRAKGFLHHCLTIYTVYC